MVKPAPYTPTKAFKLSAAEVEAYKAISAAVLAKGKDSNAKANTDRITKATTPTAAAVQNDDLDNKDKDFVGIMLGGYCSGSAMIGGELDVKIDDVYFEEPRVVVAKDDEEAADEEERSLWGDGDRNPEEADEE